jgi:hypothetical protein
VRSWRGFARRYERSILSTNPCHKASNQIHQKVSEPLFRSPSSRCRLRSGCYPETGTCPRKWGKQEPIELPALPILSRVSVREALWLLARPFDDLETEELADLSELCQASTALATLHSLVQSCGQIVRKREGHRLEDWKKQVETSGEAEVQRFAKGLERDKEAVLAG